MLPPFPCRREKGEAPFCNVCHFDLPNCFKDVLGRFRSPVRESVFFTNPLVPEAIKAEERNNPIYSFSRNCKTTTRYESSFPPRFNHNSSVICIPCSASTESCAYNVGRTVNSRVFRLLCLFPVCSIPLHSIILLFPHFQQWTSTFFLPITLLHTHASPFKSTSQCACQLLSVTPPLPPFAHC